MKYFDYLTAILLLLPTTTIAARSGDKILLSKVQTLTLRAGQKTAHRRVPAVPQLKCVGGSGKGLYEVDTMRCKNQGSDYEDENIQWTCTANLPPEFKLGSTEVMCEGYSSSTDPYVLKGSCGVEYRLILTDKGEEKFGRRRKNHDEWDGEKSPASTLVTVVFWCLFVGVILWMAYSAFVRDRTGRPRPPRTPRPRGWGGGGGGPGNDDPPPPYDWPSSKPSYANYGTTPNTGGWRPGFWSAAAGGAAAGYGASRLFGGGNNRGGNGWGGNDNGEGSSRSSRGSGSSSSSYSSTRYESSGFGGTSRR